MSNPEVSMEASAARLRSARKRAGFETAAAAVEDQGYAYSTYCSHENSSRTYSPEDAVIYGEHYGVSPAWLLFGCLAGSAPVPSCQLSKYTDEVGEVFDLLVALDLIGDGIGGEKGFAVSVVALNAKALVENVLSGIRAELRVVAPTVDAAQVSA